MKFEELSPLYTSCHCRRKSWPSTYALLAKAGGGYWLATARDEAKEYTLSAEDIAATDWENGNFDELMINWALWGLPF